MQQKDWPITYVDHEWIEAFVGRHYQLKAGQIKKLPGEIDQNYLITTPGGQSYIFKIGHPATEPKQIQMQVDMLRHLMRQELDLALPGPIDNQEGRHLVEFDTEGGSRGIARLLTWLPGRLFANVSPHSEALLESLGVALGGLSEGLQSFDHPAAHRWIKWDPAQTNWVDDQLHNIEEERRALAAYFLNNFQTLAAPRLSTLRHSVNYNDANDYNILVSHDREHPQVSGFIDFGDTVYSQTINDLAIALSYSLMHKRDPLAATLPVVRGYHRRFPLEEEELEVLFPLIGARLLLTVVNSAINRKAEPDNEYLLISERPAWELMEHLRNVPPALAHYTFRWACGLEPCPKAPRFRDWAANEASHFAPLVDTDLQGPQVSELDLSVGSLELGNNQNFDNVHAFDQLIQKMLKEKSATAGIGGYGETRPFYTTDAYTVQGNEGPQWRTVHLGLDIWMPSESAVYAPLNGIIHSLQDNKGERNYGPTIILEHHLDEELTIYTLYGHLSRISLSSKRKGMKIKRGERLGTIGPRPENGNWPPHLHFQVMLDMLGMKGDFPGVGFSHLWDVWKSICPDPGFITGRRSSPHSVLPDKKEILERRTRSLGPNLSISYREPLHIIRGYMQYLYDETGRRYLDTVNNVAHVGHEHPRVVRAARQQMAVLNTNTRYLHHQLVDYAAELLGKLPEPLEVIFFVNSGSEANELALRLARTYSGRQDMIALQAGYHGHTNACIDVSSYKFEGKGGRGAPATTHIILLPDPYRGPYRREDKDAGIRYAENIDEVLSNLKSHDRQAAGLIAESIMSCGGQIVPPPHFLPEAYRRVRHAGGVCIADEVQTGFGRVGTHFWAFEQQGVVPDIVTMGKPIGNGHPLAAVATTRPIAEAFDNGMEYFNTFGGNPVSCAVGREVLAIIEDEGLQQHALETGAYLNQCLRQLQKEHPIIGDVRGPGLFQGVELVRDPLTLEPATEQGSYLINRMRRKSILMSTDGPFENVLKIKPPMCFHRKNVDFLIDQLKEVLSEDFMQVSG